MAGVEQIKVEDGEAGMRLDRWFKVHYPGLGFGHLQKLLRSGRSASTAAASRRIRASSPARWCVFRRSTSTRKAPVR